jgi:hypothetical protein
MTRFAAPKTIFKLSAVTAAFLIAISLVSFIDVVNDNDKSIANAQVVDVDEPPTNATEELDVKVDATESLPANGTITADISEADDVDIDTIPPEGVSIVVTNSTVTVTNHPVEITEAGGTAAAAAATQDDIAGLDMGTSTASNNENEEGGSASDDDDDTGDGGSGEGDDFTNTSGSSNNEEDEEE